MPETLQNPCADYCVTIFFTPLLPPFPPPFDVPFQYLCNRLKIKMIPFAFQNAAFQPPICPVSDCEMPPFGSLNITSGKSACMLSTCCRHPPVLQKTSRNKKISRKIWWNKIKVIPLHRKKRQRGSLRLSARTRDFHSLKRSSTLLGTTPMNVICAGMRQQGRINLLRGRVTLFLYLLGIKI